MKPTNLTFSRMPMVFVAVAAVMVLAACPEATKTSKGLGFGNRGTDGRGGSDIDRGYADGRRDIAGGGRWLGYGNLQRDAHWFRGYRSIQPRVY